LSNRAHHIAVGLLVLLTAAAWDLPSKAATPTPPSPATPRPELPEKEAPPEKSGSREEGKQEAVRELEHGPSPPSFFTRGNYTFFPLPAFAYNRNEGYWIGALMPILRANEQGEVTQIYAPQYLHNKWIGENLTLNMYGYRGEWVQYRAVVSYSTKIERNFDFSYRDLGAGGGKYILGAQVNWFKNAFARFYGFGNAAPETNESNYTSREGLVNLMAGINLNEDSAIILTERYRDVRVEQGAVDDLPQTKILFAGAPGIQGANITGTKLTYRYDTRDDQLTPVSGTFATMSVEFNKNWHASANESWWRYMLDARTLIGHNVDKVFVMHLLLDGVTGHQIPFYERPTLGGENTLRAFGLSRYIDDFAVLLNFEERITAVNRKIFDYNLNLEIAPFIDIGRVGSKLDGAFFKDFQFNPGLGLRVLAKPHVVGRLDLAYGRDGANAFVGLDYPF